MNAVILFVMLLGAWGVPNLSSAQSTADNSQPVAVISIGRPVPRQSQAEGARHAVNRYQSSIEEQEYLSRVVLRQTRQGPSDALIQHSAGANRAAALHLRIELSQGESATSPESMGYQGALQDSVRVIVMSFPDNENRTRITVSIRLPSEKRVTPDLELVPIPGSGPTKSAAPATSAPGGQLLELRKGRLQSATASSN